MRVLAIDPGNTESGWVIIDTLDCRTIRSGKNPNADVLRLCYDKFAVEPWLDYDRVVIEMVASYGMAVGREVFETCVWIGRFVEAVDSFGAGSHSELSRSELVYRRDVKLHHCGQAKAKDANITQALVDRFAPGQPNHGKGVKANPGWFYGFSRDIWQSYALAVYAADRHNGRPGVA